MKYPRMDWGTMEAVVNKLGGIIGVEKFLRGELVVKAVEQTENIFSVIVDYSQSLAQMIKAGNYDWVKDDITEKHFSVEGTGSKEVELHLIHFNRSISSDEALKRLDEQGLRPATLPELLALGASQPELQRNFPVVSLGSVWQSPLGHRYVPYLWSDSYGRYLSLYWFGDGWDGSCRFAAVSKFR